MDKANLSSNAVIRNAGRLIKSRKLRLFLLPVLLIQIACISGCGSSPSDEVIKEAASWSSGLQQIAKESNLTFKEFKVTNKYEKKIHDENVYVYEYEGIWHQTDGKGSDQPMSGTVGIIKRGEKWYFTK